MRRLKNKKFSVLLYLMMMVPTFAYSQNIPVSGRVSDKTGEGLIGVTVIIPGTTTGIATDVDGNYTINVPANGKLSFSYIGYVPQTVDVSGRGTINITLAEDEIMLEEVVVVGYGIMKRSDLTGSVTSISGDAVTQAIPTSIDQVLQGRAAGVQVQQNPVCRV